MILNRKTAVKGDFAVFYIEIVHKQKLLKCLLFRQQSGKSGVNDDL